MLFTKFMFDKSSVCCMYKDYQCRQHLLGTIRMMVNSELAYEYTPNDNAKKLIRNLWYKLRVCGEVSII